jgi:hypothetical protein
LSTPEEIEVADLFLSKAASDLAAAELLARDPDQADDVVGFHAQQAVERRSRRSWLLEDSKFRARMTLCF